MKTTNRYSHATDNMLGRGVSEWLGREANKNPTTDALATGKAVEITAN